MPDTDIGGAVASDLSNAIVDYIVAAQDTDGVQDQEESTWQMTNWAQNLGYYKTVPELQTAIDTKALWTLGAGFVADEMTTMRLDTIRGNGKDNFNSILTNMVRTYNIGGDAFAEIVRDGLGLIINLKPLDPGTMVIVQNKKGLIKRYEQTSKVKKANKRFEPHEILHFSRKRIADEIHGISVVDAVEWIILARNEAMADWKKMLHRNVVPVNLFYLDTDDSTEISAFKAKMDAAYKNGENIYVPKGTVERDGGGVPPNATLSPLEWIDRLNDYFFQAVGVPQIIIGNAKSFTDASGKITYLAFEQSVKEEQLYVEEQILQQLALEIKLTFPASLQNDVVSGDTKNGPLEQAAQPDDMTAEVDGA